VGMRRRVGLFLVIGSVLPLVAVSAAWACGVLATLKLDTKVAAPGEAITATGKNYTTAAGSTPVVLHLKSRTGTTLASTTPNASGRISTTFPLPESLDPGWYVIVATQYLASGSPKSGTPGRTTLRVTGTRHRSATGRAMGRDRWPGPALGEFRGVRHRRPGTAPAGAGDRALSVHAGGRLVAARPSHGFRPPVRRLAALPDPRSEGGLRHVA
jgi:hypothetical protein